MNKTLKIVKTLRLENIDETLKFELHHSFYDSIQASLEFNNGYGVSIITKCQEVVEKNLFKVPSFGLVFSSSAGIFEDGTFEVAITKNGNFFELDQEDSRLEELEKIHVYNYGIFQYVKTEDLEKIISIVKNFRSNGHV